MHLKSSAASLALHLRAWLDPCRRWAAKIYVCLLTGTAWVLFAEGSILFEARARAQRTELPEGIRQPRVSTEGAPQLCVRCGTSCDCAASGGRLNPLHFTGAGARCNYGELSGAWAGGRWRPAPGTCPASGVGAELAAARFGGRRFYFVGNSVTRHYAMALGAWLSGRHDELVDNKAEKRACHEQLGTDSCAAGPQVQFYWKNSLSLYKAYDDLSRDICGRVPGHMSVEPCFKRLFKQATGNDVLVVGSLLANNSYLRHVRGTTTGPFRKFLLSAIDSARNNDNVGVIDMLHRVFPGVIIWHSYAFLVNEKDGYRPSNQSRWDLNVCVRATSQQARCAIDSVSRHPRAAFLDLWDIQASRPDLYLDVIHHPGPLTEEVLRVLLGMLKTIPAEARAPSVSLAEALAPTADKYVVFRCRYHDDCFGWGDRYAGILGAAAAAMSTGRSLKIDWPGLSGLFRPGSVNWTYDPVALGISPADQRVLQEGALRSRLLPRNFPDPAFQNLSQDVAVFNAYFADFQSWQVTSWEELLPYRVVVMTGNRGVNKKWLDQLGSLYGWPYRRHSEFASDMFDVLFAPTEALLSMRVPLADEGVMLLGDMAAELSRTDSKSMVLHYRGGDHRTCTGKGTVLPASSCVEAGFRSPAGGDAGRAVLVVLSDSTCLVRPTYDYLRRSLSNITHHVAAD